MASRRITALVQWCLLLALVCEVGCAGQYFREAAPPQAPAIHALASWPYREYWTGVVFNGEKVGLTHLAIVPPEAPGTLFELRSEALLAFHFLGFDKHVTLKAQDWVTADLHLARFAYDYDLDGNKLTLTGMVKDGRLLVEREAGGNRTSETIPLAEALYPTSASVLYPSRYGLAVGREYRYLVYEGQRQQVATVSQTVEAYQESDLYEGRAFRVENSFAGQRSTTWINDRAEPVLEMAWGGLLISGLETEHEAKAYLAQASVNKRDVLVEFSRVRVKMALPRPRDVTAMQVVLQGLPDSFAVPSDALQRCTKESNGTRCDIHLADPPVADQNSVAQAPDLSLYSIPTVVIESEAPMVKHRAQEIVGTNADQRTRIQSLVAWIQQNVEQEPVDVFSSMDVLNGRRAECQGLTWLYAAFARSLGIPTRVMNGLVYSTELDGFLYHTWAESYVGHGWLPVDPTFGQVGADATHIKLIEGDRLADLFPLVDVVGKIRLQILSVEPD